MTYKILPLLVAVLSFSPININTLPGHPLRSQEMSLRRSSRSTQGKHRGYPPTRPSPKVGRSGHAASPAETADPPSAEQAVSAKCGASVRNLRRFVLKTHCLALLNVISANKDAYDAVLHGATHQRKENARKKLTRELIQAAPATRECFGSDKYIEEEGASKMVDVLRTLTKKYREACSRQKLASGGGEEDELNAWVPFAGPAFEEARELAHSLFSDSPAVHLHGARSSEAGGELLTDGVPLDGPSMGLNDRKPLRKAHDSSGGRLMEDRVLDGIEFLEESSDQEIMTLSQEERIGRGVVKEDTYANSLKNGEPPSKNAEIEDAGGALRVHRKEATVGDGYGPRESLARRRANLQLAMAKRTARIGAEEEMGNTNQLKRRKMLFEKNDGQNEAATSLFSSMRDGELIRQRREFGEDRGAVIRAEGQRMESESKAREIDARVMRENLEKGLKTLQDEKMTARVKRAVLLRLGLEDLAECVEPESARLEKK